MYLFAENLLGNLRFAGEVSESGSSMPNKTYLSSIRVALVDDDLGFQKAMRDAMASSPDMVLTEVAGTYAQGMAILNGPQVDVFIIDLGLPDGSGINIIRAAHKKWPECNLMVSSNFCDEMNIMQSLEAGASGYLLKDGTPQNLTHEIRSLHSGGSPISPLIARRILTSFQKNNKITDPDNQPVINPVSSLSGREKETLEYIIKGFSHNEIASLMAVSPHTVLTFVRRIYKKLKVNSKTEAIYEARNQGFFG